MTFYCRESNDYFDTPCDPERPYCPECYESKQTIDHASDYANGIARMLVGKDNWDKDNLERMLEELCWSLGAEVQKESVKAFSITNKNCKIHNFTLSLSKKLNLRK